MFSVDFHQTLNVAGELTDARPWEVGGPEREVEEAVSMLDVK